MEVKDHEIAELVNTLRDTAKMYGQSQQLRCRIARIVVPFVKRMNGQAIEESFRECAASGAGCSYGPHGRHGEIQCKYCGESKEAANA